MKSKLIIIILLIAAYCLGQQTDKLWIKCYKVEHSGFVYFIQDKETGTRCYAITNSEMNVSGYGISCVK